MNRTARTIAAPVATLDLDHKGQPYRTPNCTGQGEHKFSSYVRVDFEGRVYSVAVYQMRPDHAGVNKMETAVYLNGRMLPEGQRANVRLAALDAYNDAFLSAEKVRAAREAFDNPAAAPAPEAEEAKPVRYIDMTPTWRGILPLYIAAIEAGTFEGRRAAMAELERMADLADSAVAAQFDSIIAKVDPVNLQSIANGTNYEFAKRGHIDAAKRRLAAMAEAPAAR